MKSKFELFREKCFIAANHMGIDVGGELPCQYELILEAGLGEVADTIMFVAIGGWGKREWEFITEIRLKPTDIFMCGEWGLFLLNTDGPDDVKFEEHTFPDRMYFSKEEAEEANIFYNGDLSLVINNFIEIPGVRTDRFKGYSPVNYRRYQGETGLQEVGEKILVLSGARNIYFKLDLPRKTDWTGSNTRLRLRLGGLLFRNATIIT
jgi:hypothetical protein